MNQVVRAMLWLGILCLSLPAHADFSFGTRLIQTALPTEVQGEIERDFGPVIPLKDIPAIHRFVDETVRSLLHGYVKVLKRHNLPTRNQYSLTIANSSMANAAVAFRKSITGAIVNDVVVTTAFLEEILLDEEGNLVQDPALLEQARHFLWGVLAHELGHSVDKLDPNGLEQKYGILASQAIEIRTDLMGTLILKEGGLPPEALYEYFDRFPSALNEKEDAATVFAHQAYSTHPNSRVRMSALRMFLTGGRFREGERLEVVPRFSPVTTAIASELARYPGDCFQTDSILEVVKRLRAEAIGAHRITDMGSRATLRFNFLLHRLDTLLIERGMRLTDDEMNAVAQFNFEYLLSRPAWDNAVPIPTSKYERVPSGTRFFPPLYHTVPEHQSHIKKYQITGVHHERVQQIPLYQSKSYVEWLEKHLDRVETFHVDLVHKDHYVPDFKKPALGMAVLLGNIDAVSTRAHRPRQWTNLLTKAFITQTDTFLHDDVLWGLSSATKEEIAQWIHRNALPKLDFEHKSKLFYRVGTHVLPWVGSEKNRTKEIAQEIWTHRGAYALFELLSNRKERLDWNWIFSEMDIPAHEGPAVIRVELHALLEKTARPLRFWGGISGRGHGGLPPLAWDNGTLPSVLLKNVQFPLTEETVRILSSHFASNKDAHIALFAQAIDEASQEGGNSDLSPKKFKTFVADLDRRWGNLFSYSGALFFDSFLARAIDQSQLPAPVKAAILKEGLMDKGAIFGGALVHGATAEFHSDCDNRIDPIHVRLLLKHKIIERPSDLLKPGGRQFNSEKISGEEHFDRVIALGDFLKEEANAVTSGKEILSLAQLINRTRELNWTSSGFRAQFRKWVLGFKDHAWTNHTVAATKQILCEKAVSLNASPQEKWELLNILTHTGGTLATDAFFDHLETTTPRKLARIEKLLKEDRILSNQRKVKFARLILEHKIRDLEIRETACSDAEALQILARVTELVPTSSTAKDAWLEEIAWRISIESEEVLDTYETAKTVNWQSPTPTSVNKASGITDVASRLSLSERQDLLDYLYSPESKPIPASVDAKIREIVDEAQIGHFEHEPQGKEEAVFLIRASIEQSAYGLSLEEKLPLIDHLLHLGKTPIAKQPRFYEGLAEKYLKLAPTSDEAKLLRAYIRSVPPHEMSFTIAYLMTHLTPGSGTSVAAIFNAFHTIGVKTGQLLALWKIAKGLDQLKSHADPMSKREIKNRIRELKLVGRRGVRVKRLVRILGSASLKTVVLAELTDGRRVVIALQRAYAADQIRSDLKRGKKFIENLAEEGYPIPTATFRDMAVALELQMAQEIRMRREAKQAKIAARLYKELNTTMKNSLKGWTFETANVVSDFAEHDTALVFQVAEGVPLAEVTDEKALKEAGNILDESALRLLFTKGWFNPDLHRGNVIVNVAEKKIYPIDFGQALTFKQRWIRADDIYPFVQWLRYVLEGKVDRVIEFGRRLTTSRFISADAKVDLQQRLAALFAAENNSLEDKLLGSVNAFSEAGVAFDPKYSFGAIKGLLVLYKEKYSDAKTFEKLLRKHAEEALRRNKLALMWDCWNGLSEIGETPN